MSAPETNVEKQARRHKWPLAGIIAVVVFAFVVLVAVVSLGPVEEIVEEPAVTGTSGN